MGACRLQTGAKARSLSCIAASAPHVLTGKFAGDMSHCPSKLIKVQKHCHGLLKTHAEKKPQPKNKLR
jgi:hypothetical protein